MASLNPRNFALAVPLAFLAEPALAHRTMGGPQPQTLMPGLLAGGTAIASASGAIG